MVVTMKIQDCTTELLLNEKKHLDNYMAVYEEIYLRGDDFIAFDYPDNRKELDMINVELQKRGVL